MAVLEVTLVPIGTQETSCSAYVAEAYKAVKDREGINISLNPMGTVMEGDLDLLFEAVRDMQEAVFEAGPERVYTVIKIDDRRDRASNLEGKVQSVMDKI